MIGGLSPRQDYCLASSAAGLPVTKTSNVYLHGRRIPSAVRCLRRWCDTCLCCRCCCCCRRCLVVVIVVVIVVVSVDVDDATLSRRSGPCRDIEADASASQTSAPAARRKGESVFC